jgi:hypothetical protein
VKLIQAPEMGLSFFQYFTNVDAKNAVFCSFWATKKAVALLSNRLF